MPEAAPQTLDFTQMTLERASFELRFPVTFLLWDRSGALWTRAKAAEPELKPGHVEPARITFRTGSMEATVETEAARIIANRPERPLKQLSRFGSTLTQLVLEELGVKDITRVGLRLIYFREYPNREQASAAVQATKRLNVPSERIFNTTSAPLFPEVSFRYDGRGVGTTVRFRAEARKVDFDPPFEFAILRVLEPVHKEVFGVSFDVDLFTLSPMSAGELNVVEWIDQAVHVVNRDTPVFLRP